MRLKGSVPIALPAFVLTTPSLRLNDPRASTHICRTRTRLASPAYLTHPCMVVNESTDDESRLSDSRHPRYGGVASVSERHHGDLESPETVQPQPDSNDRPQLDGRILIAGVGLLLVLTGGSVAAATGLFSPDGIVKIASWFEALGPNALFLYAGLYFILEMIGVPALPLTMGSGYLFGVLKGTATVSIASTAAAAAAFLVARYWLRDSVSKLASRYPRFRAMDRAIGREGFKFVLLLRLSPLLPFSLSNYLYGLTSVDLPAYLAGSWLGMLPGTIAYVSTGAAVGALTDLSAGKSTVNPVLLGVGLVATVVILTTIGKMASGVIEADEEEVLQQ